MAKKVLITGGAGFIGLNLIEYLHEREPETEITVIDDFTTGAISLEEFVGRYRPQHIQDVLAFSIEDIEQSAQLGQDVFNEFNFNIIYHLASRVGPVGVLKYAGQMGKATIDELMIMLKWSKRSNAKLIYFSTSEVYGNPGVLSETTPCMFKGPKPTIRNEYAISKLLAEITLYNIARTDPTFKFQIIRPFNVAGKYQRPEGGFVLPRFAIQALLKKPLTVYGTGMQQRAYTYVKDICSATVLAANVTADCLWNNTWNVGNIANRSTIAELADLVASYAGGVKDFQNIDPKKLHGSDFDEAPDKLPDSYRAEHLLGWKPTKDTVDIIKEIVDYWREDDKYKAFEAKV